MDLKLTDMFIYNRGVASSSLTIGILCIFDCTFTSFLDLIQKLLCQALSLSHVLNIWQNETEKTSKQENDILQLSFKIE